VSESQRTVLEAWRLDVGVFGRPTKWMVELKEDKATFVEPATRTQFDISKADARDRIEINRFGIFGARGLSHLRGHLAVTVEGVAHRKPFRFVFEGDGLVQLHRWLGLPGWGCCPSCGHVSSSLEDWLVRGLVTCTRCRTVYPARLALAEVSTSGEFSFVPSCPRCNNPIPVSDMPKPDSGKHLTCPKCGAQIKTAKGLAFEDAFDQIFGRKRRDPPGQGKKPE
jgi:transcription elongation factor Elf1